MPVDTEALSSNDVIVAQNRVHIGPLPDWVVPCPFATDFKRKSDLPLTYLLLNRQIHAERRQTFHHTAMRLENMQAVQHESQWHLPFEPRTQSVTLHWIKIRRGESAIDHAAMENIRLLQREEGLDGFVLDGWYTMLLLLEDVRPGDILEACYTIKGRPLLMPESCSTFFSLPQGRPVAKYEFTARFSSSRPMKWKASAPALQPVENHAEGIVTQTWTGEDFFAPRPEENTPDWHVSNTWIQISDCPDWATPATAFATAWPDDSGDADVAALAREIAEKELAPLQRVEQALRLIQDEHRYLSVNLEMGGQIPARPATVARRRYGDCKDLSCLLVHLLKKLGIPARPILVHTELRKSISGMLPMHGLFNHVIVEFQLNGHTRWVDATLKNQGGGPLRRYLPDYGFGLPIDASASALAAAPAGAHQESGFELRESFIIGTDGESSLFAAVCTSRGAHAESQRHHLESVGLEEYDRHRLQSCANRFGTARRAKPLEYHYDREANEFVTAEAFAVNSQLLPHFEPGICYVALPLHLLLQYLPPPEPESRRGPIALPYPCNLTHIVEIESAELQPGAHPRCYLQNPFVNFSRREKSLNGFWSMTLTLSTLTDSVPPGKVAEYKKSLESIWRETAFLLALPLGITAPTRKKHFGMLPSTKRMGSTTSIPEVLPAQPVPLPPTPEPSAPPSTAVPASPVRPWSYTRPPERQAAAQLSRFEIAMITLGVVILARIVIGLLFAMASN